MYISGLFVLFIGFCAVLLEQENQPPNSSNQSPIRLNGSSIVNNPSHVDVTRTLAGINMVQYFDINAFNKLSIFFFRKVNVVNMGLYLSYQPDQLFGKMEFLLPVSIQLQEKLKLGIGLKSEYFNKKMEHPIAQHHYLIGLTQKFSSELNVYSALQSSTNNNGGSRHVYLSGIRWQFPLNTDWEVMLLWPKSTYIQWFIGCGIRLNKTYRFHSGISSNPWSYTTGIQFYIKEMWIDLEIVHFSIPGNIKQTSLMRSW